MGESHWSGSLGRTSRLAAARKEAGELAVTCPTALEVLPEQGSALDEHEPAEILIAEVDQVEGVEARRSVTSGPYSARPGAYFVVR